MKPSRAINDTTALLLAQREKESLTLPTATEMHTQEETQAVDDSRKEDVEGKHSSGPPERAKLALNFDDHELRVVNTKHHRRR